MKSALIPKLPFAAAVLLAAGSAWAHHGSSGFDQKRPVHLVGKVSELEWINPHIVIHLDAPGADGKPATWLINTRPPSVALRLGFSKSDFGVGAELIVDGYQAADGSKRVNASNIVLKDGRKIETPACFDATGSGLPWAETKNCVPSER